MSEITLEKVDAVIARTGVTYAAAKEALIIAQGDVLEAIIYLESQDSKEYSSKKFKEEAYTTLEDLKVQLNKLIEKGNVSRIVVKRDNRILVDVPVNAGIAAGAIAIIWPPIIAVALISTLAFSLTIEITKEDGSVEVINTVIKNSMEGVKGKMSEACEDMKSKFSGMKDNFKDGFTREGNSSEEEPMYSYTVKFNEEDENKGE